MIGMNRKEREGAIGGIRSVTISAGGASDKDDETLMSKLSVGSASGVAFDPSVAPGLCPVTVGCGKGCEASLVSSVTVWMRPFSSYKF